MRKKATFKQAVCMFLAVILLLTSAVPLEADAAQKGKLNKSAVTLYVGQNTTLKLKGVQAKPQWTSSKKSVATVSGKGKVTAKKKGSATITAKANGKKYRCKITVKNPYLNQTKLNLNVGETFRLTLTGAKAKSWKSSNSQTAQTDSKGNITAKQAGTAVITCLANNKKSYTCRVTVNSTKTPDPIPTPTPEPNPAPTPVPEPTPNPEPTPTPDPEPAPTPDPDPAPEHTHIWNAGVISQEATCTKKGSLLFTCTGCNETRTEDIPALGHDITNARWETTQEATCQEEGTRTLLCIRQNGADICNTVLRTESIPVSAHDYQTTEHIAATCTEDGYDLLHCSMCGDEKTANETKATGHDYQFVNTIAPTCTQSGYDLFRCIRCSTEQRSNEVPAAHDYQLVYSQAASCTQDGWDLFVCSMCGDEKKANEASAYGHTYRLTDAYYTSSSCLEDSYEIYTCDRCGDRKKEIIEPATGHDFILTDKQEPTCTQSGWDILTCTRCGIETFENQVPATGHNYQAAGTTAATCTEDGYDTLQCSNCNDIKRENYVKATGHTEGDWIVIHEANCDEGKREEVHCTVCDAVLDSKVTGNGLGHDYQDFTVIEPTFTEPGKGERRCVRCGKFALDFSIPAKTNFGYYYMQPGETKEILIEDLDLANASITVENAYFAEASLDKENHKIILTAHEPTEPSKWEKGLSMSLSVKDPDTGTRTTYPGYLRIAKATGNVLYKIEDDHAVIIGNNTIYDGCPDGRLVVPAEIEGYPVTELAAKALATMSIDRMTEPEVTEVVLPEGLETLGSDVLYGRTIKELTIPSTVTQAGLLQGYASTIERIIFADGSTMVPPNLFKYADSLKEAVIPDSVTKICSYAFHSCRNLRLKKLPEELVEIEEAAFAGCTNLPLDSLPDSLTTIQPNAFDGSGITLDGLPRNVTYYGEACFRDCKNVCIDTIYDGVTYIGRYAFQNCTLLKSSYTIPASVVCAQGFTEARKLVVAEGTTIVRSALFDSCQKNLQEVVLPEGLLTIEGEAFHDCTNLAKINIPSTVTYIGDNAFYNTQISMSELPPSVEIYGENCFRGCKNVIIPEIPDCVTEVWLNAFAGCQTAETYVLPAGIIKFHGVPGVKKIILPEGLTRLHRQLFQECYDLEEVILPQSLTEMQDRIFQNCTSLKEISIPKDAYPKDVSVYTVLSQSCIEKLIFEPGREIITSGMCCGSIKEVVIPESVRTIEGEAFAMTSIEEIVIPEGVVEIGSLCFMLCDKLKSATIPSTLESTGSALIGTAFNTSSLETLIFTGNRTEIPSYMFCDCGPKYIEFPETLKSIGAWAFFSANIEELVLPEGLVSLGGGAFKDCSKLKTVTIPETLVDCGDIWSFVANGGPFEGSGIETVYFTGNRTSIPTAMFSGCGSLKTIEIPETVTAIGAHAFSYCSSLESITLPDGLTALGDGAFAETPSLNEITLPSGLNFEFFDYITTPPFEGSGITTVTCAEGTTSIPARFFINCGSLVTVHLPSSLTSIGDQAFMGCTKLTNITLPENLTSLGMWVFRDSGLTELTIPASVKSYGMDNYSAFTDSNIQKIILAEGVTATPSKAFIGAGRLKEVVCPSTLTTIGPETFSGCSSLESFTVPTTVTTIGDNAFTGCTALKQVTIPAQVQAIGTTIFGAAQTYPTIITTEGSAAHIYAQTGNYPFELTQ